MVVVGDVHGRGNFLPHVKEYLAQGREVTFVGDYFDSFDLSIKEQLDTFKELISLKNLYGDQMTMLLGNHDVHYIYPEAVMCTGYHTITQMHINDHGYDKWLKENCKLYNAYGDWILSHAGINKKLEKRLSNDRTEIIHILDTALDDTEEASINRKTLFEVPSSRGGTGVAGIVWADWNGDLKYRPPSLFIKQIVGHTNQGLSEVDVFKNEKCTLMNVDFMEKGTGIIDLETI